MIETVSNDDSTVSIERPALYVVATPIGNLGDLSLRAKSLLNEVDLLLVEDKRVSARLLSFYGIQTKTRSIHDHNERKLALDLAQEIKEQSLAVAQISDAGTPLISDPGYLLVNSAIGQGLPVIAVPGPCAAIAALSVSGLATDQFLFVGFLNAKRGPKQREIAALKHETRTLVFYEAPHRIQDTLQEFSLGFGSTRRAVIARELTKRYESLYRGNLAELAALSKTDPNIQKGEIVIVVEAAPEEERTLSLGPRTITRRMTCDYIASDAH